MDECTKRKLNLLIHLAKVDGKFHKAEKSLIEDFIREKGFSVDDFQMLQQQEADFENLDLIDDKQEVLFLALKLMQADKVIDEKELTFCRDLAAKLGFKPTVVDVYAEKEFDRASFDEQIEKWVV